MKKIIISVIVCLPLLILSCKKEFIELSPISTIDVDALYKTEKDFQDAVIGVYGVFRTQYSSFWQFGDLRGDDTRNGLISNQGGNRIDNFTMVSDEAVLASSWSNYYTIITRANTVLSKIESTDVSVVRNKDRHIGEAKFLRALAYFDLVRIFGDVPMVTSSVSIEEAYKTRREKVQTIYDEVIIKDLLDAEGKLPLKYTGADVGRATRGAAKSLLGKVYLTRKDFVKAEAKLLEVTTLGYTLLQNFNDLFDYTRNEHHSEYIFDIEYEEGILQGSDFTNRFSVSFQGAGQGVVNELIKLYGSAITGGLDSGIPNETLFNIFEPGDLRKDITAVKGINDVNGNFIPLSTIGVPAFSKKYMTPIKTTNDSRANWKVIRYADVLLMLAEALNENGKTGEALGYLNQVRSRAGFTNGYAGLTQEDAREKIYNERRRELYLEGHRWFDLVRTGRAYSVMQSFGMKPEMTVFPIPQNQIDIINNREIFPQNQGY